MKINLYDKYIALNKSIVDSQHLISEKGIVKSYYGVNKDGFYRLSFLSSSKIDIKGETKGIKIVCGNSSKDNFWTCFDLMNDSLLSVFCTFCEDLISCVLDEYDEKKALSRIRARYNIWVALFKKGGNVLSAEKAKGLFGELRYINDILIPKYGVEKSIVGWTGPDNYSKDFSFDDTWYEIKTIHSLSPTVEISSVQQLSSDTDGILGVVKIEEVSDLFNEDNSSINKTCLSISSLINDEELKSLFYDKLIKYGFNFSDEIGDKNYRLVKFENYNVSKDFPILRDNDLEGKAINNVSYQLILKMLTDFKIGD